MTQVDNKRIAKNTLYMYLRMLVTLAVSLYTARINFQALGIDNYGIYNIVGSIIVFFAFINQGLTTATRRYITAEIAQGTEDSQRNVFNLAICSHILIAIIIVVLGETIGLWAVNSFLNIPQERMFAANVVYQLSVFTAIMNVMQAPYTAAITAHEKMNIYAYISIFTVVAQLAVAFGVLYIDGDKLIIYAILLSISNLIVIIINRVYCHHTFAMCTFSRPYNKGLLKEMFSYMGWNLGGQAMVVLTNQGVSVLVNMFFTVAANAAMGVSNQITQIVNNFVTNFQVAFNPQITKQYVSNNFEEMNKLAIRSSKYSSYLVLLFLIPICCQIQNFLSIWLGEYPQYSVEFCILTLIGIYLDAIAAPFWMILCSDKNVKKYQIVMSSIYSFNFLGALLLLKFGLPPYSVIIARVFVYFIALVARLKLLKEKNPLFSVRKWAVVVLFNSLLLSIFPLLSFLCINLLVIYEPIVELFIKGGAVFLLTGISIIIVGLNSTERNFIINKIPIINNIKFHKK